MKSFVREVTEKTALQCKDLLENRHSEIKAHPFRLRDPRFGGSEDVVCGCCSNDLIKSFLRLRWHVFDLAWHPVKRQAH